jgi:hypothetical protein
MGRQAIFPHPRPGAFDMIGLISERSPESSDHLSIAVLDQLGSGINNYSAGSAIAVRRRLYE